MKDMKKKSIIIISIIFIFITLISLYFDSDIIKVISSIRIDILNSFFIGITYISSKIVIVVFLTTLFLWGEYKRKWILPLWLTIALSALAAFLLKILVHRPRPYVEGIVSALPSLQEASHIVWNFSFPSSHAMLAFCAVPILSKHFPRFKYVWMVFAGLVAFSRVYLGLHYLSDILTGALIGYAIGFIITKLETRRKFCDKIYRKVFG